MASDLLANFLNPPILFYFLGIAACLLKSDLEFPQPLPRFFSLYLLFAIGYKGGIGLAQGGLGIEAAKSIGLCLMMSFVVPIYAFYLLRKRVGVPNAAAVAATYGSISAVTFITAMTYLDKHGIDYGSYMVAAMALMESPAIIIGVVLARLYDEKKEGSRLPWSEIWRDAFLNGSVVLLLGSMAIGFITAESSSASMKPFTHELFYGMLCLFLLDMGIVCARRLSSLLEVGPVLLVFAIVMPLFNAVVGALLAKVAGVTMGNAFLLVILVSSASYIAVPAAMRLAVPQAKASIYLPMSLAATFPFNILIGIPLYYRLLTALGF